MHDSKREGASMYPSGMLLAKARIVLDALAVREGSADALEPVPVKNSCPSAQRCILDEGLFPLVLLGKSHRCTVTARSMDCWHAALEDVSPEMGATVEIASRS